MKQNILVLIILCGLVLTGCNKPSRLEEYKAEKHVRDSIHLMEQERSLAYYQNQLDSLLPVSDSLLTFFKYEKNERFQDLGYYVLERKNAQGQRFRFLVREDGNDLLVYRDGARLNGYGLQGDSDPLFERARHLQVVISDIKECEKRITHTSLEVQKYQKRTQKQ